MTDAAASSMTDHPPVQGRYWPPGKPRTLTVPQTSIVHNLRVSAERYPNKVALWFYGRELTYGDLYDQVGRLAGHLAAQGVRQGDRVGVWMQNSPAWVIGAFATWQLGAVVVPLPPMLQPRELAFFLQDAGITVAVVGGELYQKAKQAGLEHAIVANIMAGTVPQQAGVKLPEGLDVQPELQDGDVTLEQALRSAPVAMQSVDTDDLAIIFYTSGTTGLPKGCAHTHNSVQANTFGGGVWVNGTSEDVFLSALPYFHVTGFINSLMSSVVIGGKIVIMARWERDTARELIRDHRTTIWTNTPTMLIDLMSSPNFQATDLKTLRNVTGGGASLPAAVGQRLLDTTGILFLEGYGLSETMAQSHSNPADRQKLQCLGIPVFNVDSRIIDIETGAELPPGEVGEIVIQGPQVMREYWQRPKETQDAFIEIGGQRFFRTGDLGHMDEEGYFFFADRLKRMVNVSGLKVWPAEVENKLHGHPAIQEACVISVPDERSGERARALIVLRPGMQATPEELQAWAREQMSSYKVPREYQFVSSLPRSPTGKVAWRQLQEQARAELTAAQAASAQATGAQDPGAPASGVQG